MAFKMRNVTNFISAGTPQGLRRAMLKVNAKHGMQHIFRDIQFVEGRWYAWFDEHEADVKDLENAPSDNARPS